MGVILGPVLSFRGIKNDTWNVGVLMVTDDGIAPKLWWSLDSTRETPSPVELDGKRVWRYDIAVPQTGSAQKIAYGLMEDTQPAWHFVVPAKGASPRFAYASCNGFSSLKLMKSVEDKYRLWEQMENKHGETPFHLMVMGGDQVYADEMWETVDILREWNELSQDEGNKRPFDAKMSSEAEEFYFKLYCRRWKQANTARMLASVPTLMMWDDHDIFDGWGSYPTERQNCAVFQGLFAVARKWFRIFQQQAGENDPRPGVLAPAQGFSFGYKVGKIAFLAADMRSERTLDRVIGAEHWDKLFAWLEGLEQMDHLIVMSGIPVVHPTFDLVERFLGILPGQQELEDDLKDHWRSRSHKTEKVRLVHRLFDLSENRKVRVTILSGDVHVAALGVIQSSRGGTGHAAVINQLTSSAIVHPAPPGIMLFALEQMGTSAEKIDRGIDAEMMNFPGTDRRFIGARNWMSFDADEDAGKGRLWANWYVEREKMPYTKVIHAIG